MPNDDPAWARMSPQDRQSILQGTIDRWEVALKALSMSVDACDLARAMTVPPNDPQALRASWIASLLILRGAVDTADKAANAVLRTMKAVQQAQ